MTTPPARGRWLSVKANRTSMPPSSFIWTGQILWIHARPDNEFALRSLHVGQELYPSEERLAQWWHSPRQIFLITESLNLPRWEAQLGLRPAQQKPLGRSGTRLVIVNR